MTTEEEKQTTEIKNKLDPWDWKFPQREDLMNLKQLQYDKDLINTKTNSKLFGNRKASSNLQTDDIKGAKPKVLCPNRGRDPGHFNSNADIEGTKSRILHIALDRPSQLFIDDIEGTRSNVIKFKTKRTPQNPLCPDYKLPVVQIIYPDPPKFVRDSINIDDIDGAKPKKKREYAPRDFYQVNDIDGAKPKRPLTRQVNQIHDQIFLDVTARKKLERQIPHNPAEPEYKVRDENGELIVIGKVEKSSPHKQYVRKNPGVDFILQSRDIHGNQPGSTLLGAFHDRQRKDIRNPTSNTDIYGTNPGSLIKGIRFQHGQSQRNLNPLDPVYIIPGHSEPAVDPRLDPKGIQGCSVAQARRSIIQSQQQQRNSNARLSTAQKLDKFISTTT